MIPSRSNGSAIQPTSIGSVSDVRTGWRTPLPWGAPGKSALAATSRPSSSTASPSTRRPALRDADARYGDELSDDDPSRIERDAAADALRALIGNVQHSIVGIYGEVYADHVGLLGSLEPRPDMLARRAERIVRQLRTVPVPEPLLEGASIDIERVAARIDEATARLDRALAEVAKEKSEADAALVERDKAAVHWERVVRLVANFMVSLAEVAGEFGIAARIRPTARRLRGDLRGDELETDVPAEPEGGGDPDPNDPRLNEPS